MKVNKLHEQQEEKTVDTPDEAQVKNAPDGKGEKSSSSRQKRRMRLSQYSREDDEKGRELLKQFIGELDEHEFWEGEERFEDFRPAYWFRKGPYIVELYANISGLAAVFGYIPKEKEEEREKQDYSMMKLVFPPVKIPHVFEDEDTGEEEEDWEKSKKILEEYLEECEEYVRSKSKENKDDKKKEA